MSSPTRRDLLPRLAKALNLRLGTNLQEAEILTAERLDELMGFDSMTLLEWVGAIEEEFQLTLPQQCLRAEWLVDLRQLVEFLTEHASPETVTDRR